MHAINLQHWFQYRYCSDSITVLVLLTLNSLRCEGNYSPCRIKLISEGVGYIGRYYSAIPIQAKPLCCANFVQDTVQHSDNDKTWLVTQPYIQLFMGKGRHLCSWGKERLWLRKAVSLSFFLFDFSSLVFFKICHNFKSKMHQTEHRPMPWSQIPVILDALNWHLVTVYWIFICYTERRRKSVVHFFLNFLFSPYLLKKLQWFF